MSKKMKILLIDADSTIPNIALMKLSQFHKKNSDAVEFIKLGMKYFPHINKTHTTVNTGNYDKVYCSVIFENNKKLIYGKNIEFGGTGFDKKKRLPNYIDCLKPDYSIYPENNIVYGFLTRGCVRKCKFCFVPEKEGYIKLDQPLEQILDVDFEYSSVEFMDNNVLSHPKHKKILYEIINKKVKCSFNQGLDIRFVDKENSELLKKINYNGAYKFAFDDFKLLKIIENKLGFLTWRKPYQFRFYMYFNPETMELSNLNNRLKWAKQNKILPYVMRDISCWKYPKLQTYIIDIIQWANVPAYFVNQSIYECISRYRNNKRRAEITKKIYDTDVLIDSRDSEILSFL